MRTHLLLLAALLLLMELAVATEVVPQQQSQPLASTAEPRASDFVCSTSNIQTCRELNLQHHCAWNYSSNECSGPFRACSELINNGFVCLTTFGECMITKDNVCVPLDATPLNYVTRVLTEFWWPVGHEAEQRKSLMVTVWCTCAAFMAIAKGIVACRTRRRTQRMRAEWKLQAATTPRDFVQLKKPPKFSAGKRLAPTVVHS